MRAGLLFLAATIGVAALFSGGACTSFSGTDSPDAGDEGGGDAGADAAPAACVPAKTPRSTTDDSSTCMCTAPVVLTGTNLLDAVVVNGTIFGRRASDYAIVKADVNAVADPLVFAAGPPGVALGMASDGTYVEVATDSVFRRYTIRAAGSTSNYAPTPPATNFARVSFGATVFYDWTPTQIAKRSLADGTQQGKSTGTILDLAVDGDEAYFVVPGATPDLVTVAPFSTGTAAGTLPAKLLAFTAQGGFAYGASTIGTATQTTISRVALGGATNASVPLITEFGLVSRLDVNGDRLYWVSNRGGSAPVLGSSDLCGGDYRLLATALPTTITDVSFDADNIYVSGGSGMDLLRKIAKKQ